MSIIDSKTEIDGTGYTITQGRMKEYGTGYNITQGRTRINGTLYTIQFLTMQQADILFLSQMYPFNYSITEEFFGQQIEAQYIAEYKIDNGAWQPIPGFTLDLALPVTSTLSVRTACIRGAHTEGGELIPQGYDSRGYKMYYAADANYGIGPIEIGTLSGNYWVKDWQLMFPDTSPQIPGRPRNDYYMKSLTIYGDRTPDAGNGTFMKLYISEEWHGN